MTVPEAMSAVERKEFGAFYTPAPMAEKLVSWALRKPEDEALDPSFGGLVFLERAHRRLMELGADPTTAAAQLHGCEVNAAAYAVAAAGDSPGAAFGRLLHGDFFAARPGTDLPCVEAVVGNPPYVRYQLLNGQGDGGRPVAKQAGVHLTRMSSSWAPFVVHATAFVRRGGRMALVLPAELLHAQYATEVKRFLRRSFGRVILALFERRVFPGALQEVVILFAEGRNEGQASEIEIVECDVLENLDVDALAGLPTNAGPPTTASPRSLLDQLLPEATRDLLARLDARSELATLSDVASVDIGAVTGANAFFLVSNGIRAKIADELLRPAVGKASHVQGVRFTSADHQALLASGARCRMLVMDAETPIELRRTANGYVRKGRSLGIHQRYKCRARNPWWSVPLPQGGVPDLFLTYCTSEHPRLVANEANALHTNTLHGVRLKEDLEPSLLGAGFVNSLTLLSAELEGRSHGGGVLKLEPTEAEALILPPLAVELQDAVREIDAKVRAGDLAGALDLTDPLLLEKGLGLSRDETAALRSGAERLRARRRARSAKPLV